MYETHGGHLKEVYYNNDNQSKMADVVLKKPNDISGTIHPFALLLFLLKL